VKALWNRDPEAWKKVVAEQLELQPRCAVCRMRERPGLTLTAHHLNYERDNRGEIPRVGEDLVTVHHETCHAFVEYLVKRHLIPRANAHLHARDLALQTVTEMGLTSINQWYDEDLIPDWRGGFNNNDKAYQYGY
jgi:hypothetical protein